MRARPMTALEAHVLDVARRWAALRAADREAQTAGLSRTSSPPPTAPTRAEVLAAERALERAALALGGAGPRGRGMRLVVIESPYAGATAEEIATNVRYARACLADCLRRGEAPIASHLLYTQPGVLDDTVPAERAQGIAAGLDWAVHADASVVYVDLGISRGMEQGIASAQSVGRLVEDRALGVEWWA